MGLGDVPPFLNLCFPTGRLALEYVTPEAIVSDLRGKSVCVVLAECLLHNWFSALNSLPSTSCTGGVSGQADVESVLSGSQEQPCWRVD